MLVFISFQASTTPFDWLSQALRHMALHVRLRSLNIAVLGSLGVPPYATISLFVYSILFGGGEITVLHIEGLSRLLC
jgi:hypothetical protein